MSPRIPLHGYPPPGLVAKRGTVPEHTLEGVFDDVIQIERQVRIEGTEAESAQKEPRARLPRKGAPVALDFREQGPGILGAVPLVGQQGERAVGVGILRRDCSSIPADGSLLVGRRLSFPESCELQERAGRSGSTG